MGKHHRTRGGEDAENSQVKRRRDISIAEELSAFDTEIQKTAQFHSQDEDDELIKYLERKLSIKNAQDSEAVFKSVADEEFGGDTELFDLVQNVLDAEEAEGGFEEAEGASEEGTTTTDDGEEDRPEVENASSPPPTSESPPPISPMVWRPKHQQAKSPSSSVSDLSDRYKQIITRGFNRVGEGNLQITGDSMVQDLLALKDEVQLKLIGTSLVETEVGKLVDKISITCAEEATLNLRSKAALALLGPQAGLICILGSRFHPKILFRYLFMIVNNLQEALQKYAETEDSSSLKDLARHCVHSLALLAYFDCLDIDFLLEVCRLIGRTEKSDAFRLELLALIFRICSVELKRNYEPQFLELEAIINGVIQTCENSLDQKKNASMHVEWIRHELSNVGKHRKAPMYEKLKALKSVLGKYPKGGFQIMDSTTFMKAVLEKEFSQAFEILRSGKTVQEIFLENKGEIKEAQEDRKLRELAKKASIRAPLQQEVFIALAKSSNTLDATTNVLKCVKSPHNIEAALAVILHCMLQEKTYNPFYAAVTNGLCSLPDTAWRKKFIKSTRRGLHLLTGNEDSFAEDEAGMIKKMKLRQYINEITDSLGEKDSAQLMAKNIFKTHY